jgi:HD superfamily phosphodiesterase
MMSIFAPNISASTLEHSADFTPLVEDTATFILALFDEKLPRIYSFHNPQHTMDVVREAHSIGKACGISDDDMEILLIAAWFHDAGYTEQYEGHEFVSIELAEQFLRKHTISETRIHAVCSCIRATEMPQKPQTLVEKILCDADVSNIASDSFFEMSARLREEHRVAKGKLYTDAEWYAIKHTLCTTHQFHTDYARQYFTPKQVENAHKLEEQYLAQYLTA